MKKSELINNILKEKNNIILKFRDLIKNIFSIKNNSGDKIVTIMGKNIRLKSKKAKLKYLEKSVNRNLLYINQLKFIIDSCCDIKDCRKATGTLRLVQSVRLSCLKLVVDIFEKDSIEYWLDGGSCLGAYRHKGFIPWDDDLDIVIPRKDYEKAIDVLNKIFENSDIRVEIGGKKSNSEYFTHVARIIDHKTKFAYVDIFPYDFSNNQKISKEELLDKLYKIRKIIFTKGFLSDLRNKKCDIIKYMPKIQKQYELFDVVVPNEDARYVFRGIDSMSHQLKQTIHNFDDIYPLKKVQFEDILVSVPNNMEKFLSNINEGSYGDIMAFPPLQSMSFHIFDNEEEEKNYIKLVNNQSNKISALAEEYYKKIL